jgi:hypothetical protein
MARGDPQVRRSRRGRRIRPIGIIPGTFGGLFLQVPRPVPGNRLPGALRQSGGQEPPWESTGPAARPDLGTLLRGRRRKADRENCQHGSTGAGCPQGQETIPRTGPRSPGRIPAGSKTSRLHLPGQPGTGVRKLAGSGSNSSFVIMATSLFCNVGVEWTKPDNQRM